MAKLSESLIIGVDFSENGDNGVLIVGRHVNGEINIINAFQGTDAKELYDKLTTVVKNGEA